MENAVIERVKLIIEDKGISPRVFSKAIGFNYSTLNNYLTGRRTTIDSELIVKMLLTYDDISAEWLLREEGEMLKDGPQEVQCDECSIIRERICKLLDYVGLNPSSLSINPIIQQKLNKQINGNGALSADIIYIVLEKIPVSSAEWLLRGEGEMLKSSSIAETNEASLIEELKAENNRLKGENRVLRELNGLGERKDRSAS